MQPAAITNRNGTSIVRNKGAATDADRNAYVNSEKFWSQKVENVPVDQVSVIGCFCCQAFKGTMVLMMAANLH